MLLMLLSSDYTDVQLTPFQNPSRTYGRRTLRYVLGRSYRGR